MQNIVEFRPVPAPDAFMARYEFAPDAGKPTHPSVPEYHTDEEFITTLDSYRGSGGLARSHEVFARFGLHARPNVATLAGWIGQRKVISFNWHSTIWLPLFQFNRCDVTLQPQPGLSQVLSELGAVFDSWEIAHWFARPNSWIADST
ncbi:MAG: hypothetical protein ACYCZL_14020, partial [Polaromonas sp.]